MATGHGVCRDSCDANRSDSGCRPGEACIPFASPHGHGLAPGSCHGEVCLPGHEQASCGRPATCLPAPPASLCLPPGRAGPGARCDDQDHCRAGLVCFAGRCATPCVHGTCADGSRCLDLSPLIGGEAPYALCDPGCDPIEQRGCAPGKVCVPTEPADNGQWLGRCERRPAGAAAPGQTCAPGEHDRVGDCAPGALCTAMSSSTPECVPLCDPTDRRRCGPAATCGRPLDTRETLCLGDCDPFQPGACGPGRVCRALFDVGRDSTGATRASGRCVAVADPLPPDAPCTRRTQQACGDGLACISHPEHARCRAPCDLRPGHAPCRAGYRCELREQEPPWGREVYGWCQPESPPSP